MPDKIITPNIQIHTPEREKEYFYGIKPKFDGKIFAGPLPGRCRTFKASEDDIAQQLVDLLNLGYESHNPFRIGKTPQGWLYIFRYK